MGTLAAEKVLRVNCAGWGVSSTLPLGEAKPLAMYEVMVVNPTTIIHLFEPNSEPAEQADRMLAHGASQLKLDSDSALESISAELELRENELRQFLAKGGLLVYFMTPPFTVSGDTMSMDNFLWLYEWGPDRRAGDKRSVVGEKGKSFIRTARGKQHAFAPFFQQAGLEWKAFIHKDDLTDGYKSLANGGAGKCLSAYKMSGPKRGQIVFLPAPYEARFDDCLKECILNWYELHTGADAEKPEPDIDDDESVEADVAAGAPDNAAIESTPAPQASATVLPSAAAAEQSDPFDSFFTPEQSRFSQANSLFADDLESPFERTITKKDADDEVSLLFGDTAVPADKKKVNLDWPELDNDAVPFAAERERERERERGRQRSRDGVENDRRQSEQLERDRQLAEERERQEVIGEEKAEELELRQEQEREREKGLEEDLQRTRDMTLELEQLRQEHNERLKMQEEEESRKRDTSAPDMESKSERTATVREEKELMSRMEREISTPGVPDWCQKVSFPEIKQLHTELVDLNEEVRRARLKINEIEDRIRNLGELKDALLSLSGIRLTQACCRVFEALGWSSSISEKSAGEVWLHEENKTQAIVRIVFTQTQPNRSELAELAESVITYWGEYDIEPKGILVASTFAEKPPGERTEDDFPGSMSEFARRKNLCLFTCQQLLSIYRDVALNNAVVQEIRERILTTNGVLPGYKLELTELETTEIAAT